MKSGQIIPTLKDGDFPSKKRRIFRGYSLPSFVSDEPSKAHDIGWSNAQLLHLLKVGLESGLEEPELIFSVDFFSKSTKDRSRVYSPTQFLSIPKTHLPKTLKPIAQNLQILTLTTYLPSSKMSPLIFFRSRPVHVECRP